MTKAKRNYKDSLFRHLFGSDEQRGNALELYNALAGTSYDDPNGLELTTIGDQIYLAFKNDVSFLIGDEMVLLEHQSTHNPNMPLRGLLYISRLMSKYVVERKIDLYRDARYTIPTPRYYVLYFGAGNRPDREVMRLSDSFASPGGDLELTVTVLNCNEGHNSRIMEASKTLKGYSHLLALVYERRDMGDLQQAIDDAIDQCIEDGYLVDYLTKHRAEVGDLLFTEYDAERAMRLHYETIRQDATAEGLAAGHEKGLAEGRAKGLAEGRARGLTEGRREGRAEGKAEGKAEGRAEERERIIELLRENGVSEDLLAKV